MRLDRSLVLALALGASLAHAQLAPVDPDWREVEAPAPGAISLDGLIALDMPRSTLRFGVAPGSVTLGSDGIVRYVVVATSTSGVVNGLYEGIRCSTGDHKVYARHNPGSGWVVAKDAQWQPVQQTRHALAIARTGACVGHGANRSASKILSDLRSPVVKFDRP
jgi:hypothetical protein